MNVIIANKYKEMLMSLDIEVIKSMDGEFDAVEIIDTFSNFYFDRMILDITAIKDYKNIDNLQKLSINLDMTKVILLLDDSDESSSSAYLSRLISMGIYNFTRNMEGVKYLLNNPNSYRDVAHIHNVNISVNNNEETGNSDFSTTVINTRVIGVKDLTDGAGATTLVYMMKKQLQTNYSVCAIEVDKRDFMYFDESDMISTTSADLPKELMKKRDLNVVLIDLNNYNDLEICNDIIYLVEPSIIKLNRLLRRDKNVFEKNINNKIVLNKSNIPDSELNVFEYEAKTKVFYNLGSLDERKELNPEINGLLSKLGFAKQSAGVSEEDSSKNKLLGMFKF